jgi:manganese oxidase
MDTKGLDQTIRKLVPSYMAMGKDGMGEMGEMGMPVPKNSLPMVGAQGQFDYITMGGMFTILKVRDEAPADSTDPGWYQNPSGTVSNVAPENDLKRDGINT